MAALSFDPRPNIQTSKNHPRGPVHEEIEGLIKVYRDGRVERPSIVPSVSCMMFAEVGVTARDVIIDKFINLWARIYVPAGAGKLPTLVYFHGGGFCVGSAAWICYHEFLTNLASKANCVIISLNCRLAPESRLPCAYDDGFSALKWMKEQALDGSNEQKWWSSHCNLSRIFLAGDSAGANIAYNVAARIGSSGINSIKPLTIAGLILIQPFIGGEARTGSEKHAAQPPNSALTLSSADTYWRLSLPLGASRDHPWCNPLSNLHVLCTSSVMVCVSEQDILRDRNLQFASALANTGKKVETRMYRGVGHAFQILDKSQISKSQTHDMMLHIKGFIN